MNRVRFWSNPAVDISEICRARTGPSQIRTGSVDPTWLYFCVIKVLLVLVSVWRVGLRMRSCSRSWTISRPRGASSTDPLIWPGTIWTFQCRSNLIQSDLSVCRINKPFSVFFFYHVRVFLSLSGSGILCLGQNHVQTFTQYSAPSGSSRASGRTPAAVPTILTVFRPDSSLSYSISCLQNPALGRINGRHSRTSSWAWRRLKPSDLDAEQNFE